MNSSFKKNIEKKFNFSVRELINLICLIFVVSGIFGFIYETIFYKIDLGYFIKRGTTYGPWIPIYGFGGIFITYFTYKYRNNPLIVFLISCTVCGILEYLTGYLLLNLANTRLWNYNTEIWNFGNIGGFVCLRSVLFFGLSGIFLVNVIIPVLKSIMGKIPKSKLNIISITLALLFLIDFVINIIF